MDSTTLRTGLCDLPDEIIVYILSLLPTKFAITTSLLLSRRWHYLWTFITNLKLSQDMFKESSQFINFVDRAMDLRKGSSLKSFSLRYRDASRVNAWITSAVQCNVVHLALKIDPLKINRLLLPVCLFYCQSLEKLELIMRNDILSVSVPSSCSRSVFSNLKSLSLCGVTFGDYESAQKMLSCPLLEELSIKRCNWDNVRSIWVFSPNLKVLDIEEDYRYVTNILNANYKAKVCFVTDNLRSFRYSGCFCNKYQICVSSSSTQLTSVEIYDHTVSYCSDIVIYVIRYFKLMNGLSKAQTLTLSADRFLMALESTPEQLEKMPVFECLTRLNLESSGQGIRINSTVLRKIFERCPNLERLDIDVLVNAVMVSVLNPMIMCFQTHLKMIYIGTTYQLKEKKDAISVLLNSCAVLEKMVVNRLLVNQERYGGSINIEELQNELNRRPRVSKDCRIVLKHVYFY